MISFNIIYIKYYTIFFYFSNYMMQLFIKNISLLIWIWKMFKWCLMDGWMNRENYLEFFGQIRIESMVHGDELFDDSLQILLTFRHQFDDEGVGSQSRFRLAAFRIEIGGDGQETGPLHPLGDQLGSREQELVEQIGNQHFTCFSPTHLCKSIV